jgi:hypothetical protein
MAIALDPRIGTTVGHSAQVELFLHVGTHAIPLADIGSRDARLSARQVLPAGPAIVEIITDGRSFRKQVQLAGSETPTDRAVFVQV